MAASFSTWRASECSKPAVRRLPLLSVLLLIAISLAADQTATVRGEIVDSFCNAARGVRGPAHTACALRCARKGIPLVLVEDGTRRIYLLMPPKDDSAMPANVIAAAGTLRTVTGRVYINSGTRFLTVDAIR